METIENNILIAEFDQKYSEGFGLYDFNGCHYKLDELEFHKSWDWLRPVVIKIEQVCEGVPQELLNISLYSDINEVYNAVVKFIKRYNEQN